MPVLINVDMPAAADVPETLLPLRHRNAKALSRNHWNLDVDELIDAIRRIAGDRIDDAATQSLPERPRHRSPGAVAPAPTGSHYDSIVRYMTSRGTLIPLLGSELSDTFPTAAALAAELVRRFGGDSDTRDLAKAAREVVGAAGRAELDRVVRELFTTDTEPAPVHRFLARLPTQLRRLGLAPQHQLIMTTSYDTALERAFTDENEPYDLVVYVAAGPDRGKFVHRRFGGDPPVLVDIRYRGLPIDQRMRLSRSLTVKTHGSIDAAPTGYGRVGDFAISEDDQTEYLNGAAVESVFPPQLVAKIRNSHCLFLGSSPSDWRLQILANRIWRGRPPQMRLVGRRTRACRPWDRPLETVTDRSVIGTLRRLRRRALRAHPAPRVIDGSTRLRTVAEAGRTGGWFSFSPIAEAPHDLNFAAAKDDEGQLRTGRGMRPPLPVRADGARARVGLEI